MPFQIIRNDITKVKADAIVNTANPEVAIGDGVDSAIYKAAGEKQLLAKRQKIGYLAPGEVGITPAFDLDAKYIIHASGPCWEGGNKNEANLLKDCYDKSLQLAAKHRCKSIAFPLLATGAYGFPQKLGMEIAVSSFTAFLEKHDMEIFLVVFGQTSVKISGELGEEVASYIDDEYVAEAFSEEYRFEGIPDERIESAEYLGPDEAEEFGETDRAARGLGDHRAPFSGFAVSAALPLLEKQAAARSDSLDDVIKGIYKESFEKHLQKLINKKGLKNSEVYAAANISKQYFSKLLKGKVRPSKEKVLALSVGLRLNLDETVDFLKLAGYALSPISQTDAVVEYFIEHEDYNVLKIDIVLFDYGLDPLSNG